MCRAKGEGGRRCSGCVGPTALGKHNDRRRANRAIRRHAVEWARREGLLGDTEAARLAAAPPNEAKAWLKDRGLDPDDFVAGAPSADAAALGPAGQGQDPQRPQSSPSLQPVAPPIPQPVGRGRGGGGGAAGGGAAGAGGAPEPAWTTGAWCTSTLRDQIRVAMQQQGVHRDERALLGGTPAKVTTLSSGGGSSSGPAGGTNTTRRVELDNGAVGYFKPFDGENRRLAQGFGQDSAQQSLHEAAAWRLASQMGPPWSETVPPVVVREMNGEIGSFALERSGKTMEFSPWDTAEWREAAFFDCLIGQQDRHPGNYLVAGDRLTLIDHGYAFARPGDYKNYTWLAGQRTQGDTGLSYQERDVLQRLVSSPNLMGLETMLERDRAQALRSRAERMLSSGTVREEY